MNLDPTPEKKAVWKSRLDANYPVVGSPFSGTIPNEKNRLLAARTALLANPSAEKFKPKWPTTAAIAKLNDTTLDWGTQGGLMHASALLDYINGTELSKAAILNLLFSTDPANLGYFEDPKLDHSNQTMFSLSPSTYGGQANPFFSIAQGDNRLLETDILIRLMGWMSSAQVAKADTYFLNDAKYFMNNVRQHFSKRFVGGMESNFVFTSYSNTAQANDPKKPVFYDHVTGTMGPLIGFNGEGWNNRILTQVRFVCKVAYRYNNAEMINFCKKWWEGQMKLGTVFHNGFLIYADESRSNDSPDTDPVKGARYAVGMADGMTDMAEIARACDDNWFYEYNLEGKTIKKLWENYLGYANGVHNRYASLVPLDPAAFPKRKVGVVNLAKTTPEDFGFQFWAIRANNYYQDNAFRAAIVQRPFSGNLKNIGPNIPYGGNANTRGSILLQDTDLYQAIVPEPVKQNQSITPITFPTSVVTFGDAAIPFTPPTSTSNLAVTVVVTGAGIRVGNTISITGAGSITVTSTQAGNDAFNAAPTVVQTITVNKAVQDVTFDLIPEKTVTDPAFSVPVSGPLALTLQSTNTAVLTQMDADTFQIEGVGTGGVRAFNNGNANYLPYDFTRVVIVKNIPVVGIIDLVAGKTPAKTTSVVQATPTTKYMIFEQTIQIGTPATNYQLTRFYLKTGKGIQANRWRNFKLEGFNGTTWVDILHRPVNPDMIVDVPITGTAIDMVRITCVGQAFGQLEEIKLFGKAA